MIRVRLFAALREIAGASEVSDVAGRTVGDIVDALGSRFGKRFTLIATASSFVVNEDRATRATPVADGDEVAILPPVSGGAADPLGSRRRTGPGARSNAGSRRQPS